MLFWFVVFGRWFENTQDRDRIPDRSCDIANNNKKRIADKNPDLICRICFFIFSSEQYFCNCAPTGKESEEGGGVSKGGEGIFSYLKWFKKMFL